MNRLTFILLCLFLVSCGYSPKEPGKANNTVAPIEVVKEYLRALEIGDWDTAESLLAPGYRLRSDGDNWIKGRKSRHVLESYKLFKDAFPRFYFKEELLERMGNGVRLGVYYTGTQRDTLELRGIPIPPLDSTGVAMRLPVEYHNYYVENDQIVFTFCEIPAGHGVAAILEQLTKEETIAPE
ncbi:MAG: ester cyclase [Bacteroidetes bacterium]|nr:ester cyclase [Bacteroidota bacterium]